MTFAPKHILVPITLDERDGLELAEYLVDVACDLARVHAARLTLLTVERFQAEVAACQRALDALTERARGAGVEATSVVVVGGDGVAEAIRDVARGRFADLIVICTHARKGWRRALLGSVAERVVHIADTPVMLVRPPWPIDLRLESAPIESELASRDAR